MKRLSNDQKQQRADLVTRLNDAAEAVRANALGEELEFYPRRSRLKSSRGPARHNRDL